MSSLFINNMKIWHSRMSAVDCTLFNLSKSVRVIKNLLVPSVVYSDLTLKFEPCRGPDLGPERAVPNLDLGL